MIRFIVKRTFVDVNLGLLKEEFITKDDFEFLKMESMLSHGKEAPDSSCDMMGYERYDFLGIEIVKDE